MNFPRCECECFRSIACKGTGIIYCLISHARFVLLPERNPRQQNQNGGAEDTLLHRCANMRCDGQIGKVAIIRRRILDLRCFCFVESAAEKIRKNAARAEINHTFVKRHVVTARRGYYHKFACTFAIARAEECVLFPCSYKMSRKQKICATNKYH